MRDLTCHFCKGPCEARQPFMRLAKVRCLDPDCGYVGPLRPTITEAVAAHLSVQPAVVKTTDFPKTPGWYWCLIPDHGWIIDQLDEFDCKEPLRLDHTTHVAGPIPLPLEPGEGGGA